MTMESSEPDEPLTPAGRLFVQPKIDQVINCSVGSDLPLDVAAIRTELQTSFLVKHPRFCSLMVTDSSGREHWHRTKVNVDRHLIIHHHRLSSAGDDISDEDAVNDYIADLTVSTPLSNDKPLWEIHLLMAHNTVLFRLHHALGDGISLMSVLLSSCRRADDPEKPPSLGVAPAAGRQRRRWTMWKLMKVVWYTLVYVLEFAMRGLWKKDKTTVLSGGEGVELWPRRLATARFRVEDMKIVKRAVADATINDVLFGIISSGFSRYLEIRSPKALQEGLQLTGMAMVNLRSPTEIQDITELTNDKSAKQWGNKFGILLLPVYYHSRGSDPIQYVRRSKSMIDKKKLSLEAPLSYKIGDMIMSLLGPKAALWLNYRLMCNTTFTISNVVGPQEKITIAGSPVKYIRATSSSLPHAITMHMVSYAGVADMQILVAKEVIPDPKILAKCFEDALLEMKEAANTASNVLR